MKNTKKQWIILLTLSALGLMACKNRETRYVYYDDDPKKPHKVFEVDKETGKLDGSYKEYAEDGTLWIECSYKDGRLDGLRKAKEHAYYDVIQTVEENYKDGLLNGVRKVFNGNGSPSEEESYKNGLKDGIFKSFIDDGTLISEKSYKNDMKDGSFKEFNRKGMLRKVKNYKEGALIGSLKVYNEDGQLVSEGKEHALYFTDPRDNQSYPVVSIGNQVWMSAKLNYKTNFSYCFNDDESYCSKTGRLYTWNAAKTACPAGWHLPSREEFNTLFEVIGKDDRDLFFSPNSDYSGYRNDKGFLGAGDVENRYSGFWSSTEINILDAYCVYMFSNCCDYGSSQTNFNKDVALSVLCLKDGDSRSARNVVEPKSYIGYWLGEGNMIFDVFTENGEDFIIRNVNGDLKVKFEDGILRGKNSLDMDISMTVKGDSAYYQFGENEDGSIITGYKRISKEEYDMILDEQKRRKMNSTNDEVEESNDGRSSEDIMEIVNKRTPGLEKIYNKFLEKRNGFAGKVSLKFTIAPSGEIISISIASSTTGYSEFDREIKNAVSRWTFNKVRSGNTTVTVPFTFSE